MKKLIYIAILIFGLVAFSEDNDRKISTEEINNIINNSLSKLEKKGEIKKLDEPKTEKDKEVSEKTVSEELKNYEENTLDIGSNNEVYNLAITYVNQNLYESANRLVRKDKSNDIKLIYIRAATSRMIGDYDDAINSYNLVLQKDPNHLKSILGLGLSYRGKGNIGKAIYYLEMYNNKNADVDISTIINRLKNSH